MHPYIIILIGIIAIILSRVLGSRYNKLISSGIPAEGVVFEVEDTPDIDSQVRLPVIRFCTAENMWITEQSKFGIGFTLKKAQRVEVVYDPSNPKNFVIKSGINKFIILLGQLLGIVLIISGIISLVRVHF